MKKFRKTWTQEKNDFLLKHKEMAAKDSYPLFLQAFPDSHDITFTAFVNHRSRIRAIPERYNNYNIHAKKSQRPIFSKQIKKYYIRIKIAQPDVWMFKHHYVWWQNTGHKPTKTETVVFLDGNNRNFDFQNLMLVPRTIIGILNNPAFRLGVVKNDPELTKINIQNAMLIFETRKLGKKMGLVYNRGAYKDETLKKIKKRMTQEKRFELNKKAREYTQHLKTHEPEKYQKKLEYCRKYYREHKEKYHKKK